MYKLNLKTGEVIRLSDNKVVAPAQSVDDPDYGEYINWINAGNSPENYYGDTGEDNNPPPPPPPTDEGGTWIRTSEFLKQFSDDQLMQILANSRNDAEYGIVVMKLLSSDEINLDGPIPSIINSIVWSSFGTTPTSFTGLRNI